MGDGTRVTLVHDGLGDGESWAQTRAELEKEWQSGLYLEFIQKASEEFPDDFCHLYGKSGMSHEFLRDLDIKSVPTMSCIVNRKSSSYGIKSNS